MALSLSRLDRPHSGLPRGKLGAAAWGPHSGTTGYEPFDTTGYEPFETTGYEPFETTGDEPFEKRSYEPFETTGCEPFELGLTPTPLATEGKYGRI